MMLTPVQKKICGLFLLILFSGLAPSVAENVSLSWDASSDSGVVGYNIYYGKTSGSYSNKISVGNITTATISNLVSGETYYFVATARDSNDLESDFSNKIQFIVPGALTFNPGLNPGDAPLIKFPVAPTHWYEVQATTNFVSWNTIWQTGVATSNAWVEFSDPEASAYGSRFYRLVLH